jgi:hypothetical protein
MELRIIAKTDKRWDGSAPARGTSPFVLALVLGLALLACLSAGVHAAGSQSPLGLWKTFDD